MPTSTKRIVQTLRAQWLGQQLRDLREQRGLTLKEAADYLGRNLSALSRYELAEWPIRPEDVAGLLTFYGLHDKCERDRFLQMAEDVWRTDQWDAEFADAIYDPTFVDLPWLERRAKRICSYEVGFVPGLLQTPEYAEAIIRSVEGSEASDAEIARWVALRMERQRILDGADAPRFEVIVDESVLRRPVGGATVLRGQLEHLLDAGRRQRVAIHVLPLSAGGHVGLYGPFVVFELPSPYPQVAYVENLAGRLYLETPKSKRFVRAYDRLRMAALDRRASAEAIAAAAEGI